MTENNSHTPTPYVVRLKHDDGVHAVTVHGHALPESALATVLDVERAPRRSVLSVTRGAKVFDTVVPTNGAAEPSLSRRVPGGRQTFRNRRGTFYALNTSVLPGHTGSLPEGYRDNLAEAFDTEAAAGRALYVVWSYTTPIAWQHDGMLIVPDVTYTTTTTRVQNICRGAYHARPL